MLKNIKSIITTLSLVLTLAAPSLMLAPAYADTAQSKADACAGIGLSGGDCGGKDANKSVNTLITNIVNLLSMIVGVIAVIMIIVAGLRYVTSGGGSNGVAAAKNTLIYAIVGLVVVALAQFIVRFVVSKAVQ